MIIDAKETIALAEMLRIRLTEEEAAHMSQDMSSVLDYVRLLDEVDVTGTDPMAVGLAGYARLRDDVPAASLPTADLEMMSGGAFDPQQGGFITKPVFE